MRAHRRGANTAAWHAAGGSLLTGDGITDDTLLAVFRFLPTAKDLVRVLLTCRRFSIRCIAATVSVAGPGSWPVTACTQLHHPYDASGP